MAPPHRPAAGPAIAFADPTFAQQLGEVSVACAAAAVATPSPLVCNRELATELGLDPQRAFSDDGIRTLLGQDVRATIAQGYAGHQFGGFSPRLGDGRALLLGEILDGQGDRWDLHLKGSGPTPFSRGGDGFAAVGPMLREHIISEAMHALGIPTTRALAVIATGHPVVRATRLPGAVLVRVASSHLRVGTFEYVAHTLQDSELLARLLDYAIARHHPAAAQADEPALAFLTAVVQAQAALVAQWMLVGFVHGVMNTDNMTISGETIDYGPCAFMETFDPATVFSSIDHGGRYAYGQQPAIAQWNLARLAETLLPLIAPDRAAAAEAATAVLSSFPSRFGAVWHAGMAAKVGLADRLHVEDPLIDDLHEVFRSQGIDWTQGFRALGDVATSGQSAPLASLATDGAAVLPWVARWLTLRPDGAAMGRTNPRIIPRNALVEDALTEATVGNLAPYESLVAAVTQPFSEDPAFDVYARSASADADHYVTYCGT